MAEITVRSLHDELGTRLGLRLLAGAAGLERRITVSDVSRPGLALVGYLDYFQNRMIQVIGLTEVSFLTTMPPEKVREHFAEMFRRQVACMIFTRNLAVPPDILQLAEETGTPLFTTPQMTTSCIAKIYIYLEHNLAPRTSLHGVLIDVFGVGVLLTGSSGIGKSECALDLIERGHRLVADDVVTIKKRGERVLMGYGNQMLQHHMEIRGIGIVDLTTLFGIRSVRMRKRIEVEVRLKRWSDDEDYERLGLEEKPTTILGVEIPLITVPVVSGKNISVISEVLAMNHLLKLCGYSSAEEFNNRLLDSMQKKFESARFVEDDLE
ncbi:TPA: HPr(Ser) kinase/phosphatase [Candidatus Edwardsbacteria bacterium]|nr:HPr(Ser) kinase/phosphatase [Candidatus Edwardsbacteria bacterium]